MNSRSYVGGGQIALLRLVYHFCGSVSCGRILVGAIAGAKNRGFIFFKLRNQFVIALLCVRVIGIYERINEGKATYTSSTSVLR